MELEAGEYYKNHSGTTFGPMKKEVTVWNYYWSEDEKGYCYTESGKLYGDEDSKSDLIEKVSGTLDELGAKNGDKFKILSNPISTFIGRVGTYFDGTLVTKEGNLLQAKLDKKFDCKYLLLERAVQPKREEPKMNEPVRKIEKFEIVLGQYGEVYIGKCDGVCYLVIDTDIHTQKDLKKIIDTLTKLLPALPENN